MNIHEFLTTYGWLIMLIVLALFIWGAVEVIQYIAEVGLKTIVANIWNGA